MSYFSSLHFGPDPKIPAQTPEPRFARNGALLVALAFLLCACEEIWRVRTFNQNAVATLGVIELAGLEVSWGRRSSGPHPVFWVGFESQDGVHHSYRWRVSDQLFRAYRTGEPVRVWYVPAQPWNSALLERSTKSRAGPFGLAALLFLAIAGWYGLDMRIMRGRGPASHAPGDGQNFPGVNLRKRGSIRAPRVQP